MTRDAFFKAQEIEKKLDAVHQMQNIITNSTLARDDEYYRAHNRHVKNDDMILCYMSRSTTPDVSITHSYNCLYGVLGGDFEMNGNFIYGKDVPLDLVERLEHALSDYETELNKEFDDLSGDYVNNEFPF